jgi:FKBP-type peptidyl-prolyl cis-trans isomerase FkpA/FKBP-type peptidyl-prolyl cis-trans isomerase FklB
MTARTARLALVLALASAPLLARAADPVAPATEDQKTVYAIGYSSAQNLERLALRPEEIEIFLGAVRDGLAGKEAPVDVETYASKVQAFAQSRAAAASAGEKTAATEFLAKEAAAPGATKAASGLVKRVVKEGSGAVPTATDTVKVHYHGTLRDGTVFDSSVDRGEPAEFPLNRVIPCWTEAVQTMKVGEKAHITCPPEIAYGDRGFPPKIPGGAALAFDVELIEIVTKN